MITNLDQVVELVAKAIGGKAYISYPQKRTPKDRPMAVVSLVPTSYMRDRDGKDIATMLTYTIRVHAKGQRELLDLTDRVVDELAPYKARLIGSTPMYSDDTYGPYRILTFDMILDRRGQTYSTG